MPLASSSHLIVAADACGQGRGRYENFFFGCEPASPPAFIGHIDATLAAGGWRRPGFERGENGITVPYKDGVFTVEFGRMPVLAALFEFAAITGSVVIALALADEEGLNLPLSKATYEQYRRMIDVGKGDLDKSGVAELTFRGRN